MKKMERLCKLISKVVKTKLLLSNTSMTQILIKLIMAFYVEKFTQSLWKKNLLCVY